MAKGQRTALQLVNRVLIRLGKPQVTSFTGIASGTDNWGSLALDMLNDGQQYLYTEHDWSTLYTTGTFTTSSRTYDLSSSFSDFGRAIDLVDTTNQQILTEISPRQADAFDPILTTAGAPDAFSIEYPNLLFNLTPSAVAYRLRYLKRPTAFSGVSDTSLLPEYCDLVLQHWAYWQLLATREDASDGGGAAKRLYDEALARAIAQDQRRTDKLYRMQSVWPRRDRLRTLVPYPPQYDTSG